MIAQAAPPSASQRGAALITVLTVLAALGIGVALLLDQVRPGRQAWVRSSRELQALYLAESGLAYQLYLERFSDSADPSMGASKGDSAAEEAEPLAAFTQAERDSFQFHLDSTLQQPDVTVDRSRAYLDITAKARFRGADASIFARFGKALDDSIFGPALTLENAEPLETFPREQIIGGLRLRTPGPGTPSMTWPENFSLAAYIAEFTDKKYNALESSLQKQLGEPGTLTGNGNFEPSHPPVFTKDKALVFPLGQVEFRNDGNRMWVIRGPGRIFAEGEIRVKGLIRFENVSLLSGQDITFEDSITGEGVSAFARRSIFFHNRCNLEIEAVAGKHIILEDHSQSAAGSVLLSVGNQKLNAGGDSSNAIRVVNDAVARGFLIAGGDNGRVVIGTPVNRVDGVVMAASVWLAGTVNGPVVARKLLCEGTNSRNCLGPGHIDRSRLPPDFIQPLELGSGDRRTYRFKLLEWKRT